MADKDLTVFEFRGQEIRVVMKDGEPWWVLADVARALGYRDAFNASRVLKDHQKDTHSVSTSGGPQFMLCTNEGGLNRLILRSDKESAEPFQDWVCDEILPSIRRTGAYSTAAGMGTISPISVEEFLVQQAQAILAHKRALEQVQAIAEGALAEVQETKQIAKVLEHRITNLDHIDINGTLRQRLEGMIKLFARREGIHYPEAWKEFDRRFNTAFKTNLTARRKNFAAANGLKKVPSRPEYLEREGLLEDAIRVADKMLNPRRDGE